MRRLKLGIVGCGIIGREHARAAAQSPRIDLVAVADVRQEAAEAMAKEFGATRIHPSAEAMLEDEAVEAVVLALPAGARQGLGERAARQGKHVLLEKPPGMDVSELHAIQAAQGDRVVASCSSRFRLLPVARAAAAHLASDTLGRVRLVRFRGIGAIRPRPEKTPPAWRLSRELNGGGILVNWGIYDLDFLLGLLHWRLEPVEVLAQAWPTSPAAAAWVHPASDAESHVVATVRCRGGEAIHLERGEMMPTSGDDAWQIIGERSSLRLGMLPWGERTIVEESFTAEAGLVRTTIWNGDTGGEVEDLNGGPVCDFADAILDGREPATPLKQAVRLQRLIDAIYTSAEDGCAIRLGD